MLATAIHVAAAAGLGGMAGLLGGLFGFGHGALKLPRPHAVRNLPAAKRQPNGYQLVATLPQGMGFCKPSKPTL